MLNIVQGMRRDSLGTMDRFTFERYDTNHDGVISYSEYNNFLQVSGVNKVNKRQGDKQENRGFNLEQFDPQGPINFESNGGYNSTKLNILA